MVRRLPRVEMTVPASGLSKVMGKRGTNLENIRKVSLYLSILLFLTLRMKIHDNLNLGIIVADNYALFCPELSIFTFYQL